MLVILIDVAESLTWCPACSTPGGLRIPMNSAFTRESEYAASYRSKVRNHSKAKNRRGLVTILWWMAVSAGSCARASVACAKR